ncbi:MAG: hypothetical protein ABWZ29_03225 [Casimicrobiaceae bacterium]
MTRAVRASPSAGACRVAERESRAITALAQQASVEMTCHDNAHLDACRALLATGASVYVSYLPGQTWRETLLACAAVRASGWSLCRISRCVNSRISASLNDSSRTWSREREFGESY